MTTCLSIGLLINIGLRPDYELSGVTRFSSGARPIVIGWALNLVYAGLLLVLSPVLVFRALWQGKYRQGWAEKLWGRGPSRTTTGPQFGCTRSASARY